MTDPIYSAPPAMPNGGRQFSDTLIAQAPPPMPNQQPNGWQVAGCRLGKVGHAALGTGQVIMGGTAIAGGGALVVPGVIAATTETETGQERVFGGLIFSAAGGAIKAGTDVIGDGSNRIGQVFQAPPCVPARRR